MQVPHLALRHVAAFISTVGVPMQRPKAAVRPSAPMYDDGGARDPHTRFQPGALVRIRGSEFRGSFPVVGELLGGALTVLAQTFPTPAGPLVQRELVVFTCTLTPHVPAAPAIPAGALDEPESDPDYPQAVAGRVSHLKVAAEPSANGKRPKPTKPTK